MLLNRAGVAASSFGAAIRAAIAGAAVLAMLAAAPAAAQFSDAYNFLKAVRDQDAPKAQSLLSAPGTVVVDTRDPATGEAPLHIVVKRHDVGWLGLLLNARADPEIRDRDGNTPMLLAAMSGFSEGVRILLVVNAKVDSKNNAGETPLIKAVQAHDLVIAKMLLDAGANPDLADNSAGYTARDYALQTSRGGPIARLLKDAKARTVAPAQGPSR